MTEQILPNYLATAQDAYAFGHGQGAQRKAQENQSRLSLLASQAYGAPQDQRAGIVQQAVGIDPDAGFSLDKQLQGGDDAREKSLLNTARLIDQAPPEMKEAIFQRVRPAIEQHLPNLPANYNDQVGQGIKAFIASRSGGGRDVKVVGNSLVDAAGNVVYQAPQRYMTAQGLIEVGPNGVRELRVGEGVAQGGQVTGPDGLPIDISGITDPQMRAEIVANPALWQAAPDGGEVRMSDRGERILPASSVAQQQQMALAREAAERANRADARAAEAAARAQREADTRARFGTIPPGFRVNATGTALEPAPGGPKPAGSTATEGERKAATLLKRLDGSLSQLNQAVAEDKSAASPSVGAEFVRAIPLIGGDTAARLVNDPERRRVEAAQLDILDAALTLGTGAAYTKEQLRGYAQSYFPQIGDDENDIADKAARLQNVIQAARIAAGRAAPAAEGGEGGGGRYQVGQVIEHGGKRYRVTGGDPNDPDVEEVR